MKHFYITYHVLQVSSPVSGYCCLLTGLSRRERRAKGHQAEGAARPWCSENTCYLYYDEDDAIDEMQRRKQISLIPPQPLFKLAVNAKLPSTTAIS
jgi:hypothetical protein